MANLDGPFGFRSVRPNAGGTSGRLTNYTIASGYTSSIFYGDAVIDAGSGVLEVAAATDAAILGIFQGCSYDDEAGRPKFSRYWPADQVATNIVAQVNLPDGETYLVQSTTVAAANIGQYCDLVAGAGDPATGNSGFEIDGTTYNAASTGLTFQVVRIANSPDNAAGADANIEVRVIAKQLGA